MKLKYLKYLNVFLSSALLIRAVLLLQFKEIIGYVVALIFSFVFYSWIGEKYAKREIDASWINDLLNKEPYNSYSAPAMILVYFALTIGLILGLIDIFFHIF